MQCYKQIFVKHNDIYHLVPCGKCNFCLQNTRNDWGFRLLQEQKVSQTANFITLTYDNENLPYTWEDDFITGVTLEKKHLFTFHKTLKQKQRRLLKKEYNEFGKIRYYSVGEYGSQLGRPHYHCILFNVHPIILQDLQDGLIWEKGLVHTGFVTPASVNYVAKYVIDRVEHAKEKYNPESMKWEKQETKQIAPFNCMSRNPGIGANYMINRDWHREVNDYNPENFRIYAMQDGKKVRLPRYYKDKIFKEVDQWYEDVMKTSLELHNMELADQFEKTYLKELEDLENKYELTRIEAMEKIQERTKHHHDQIRIKSLKLNTL